MLYDLYKREVEDRAEKKTTEEKSKQDFEVFVRSKLARPDKKR